MKRSPVVGGIAVLACSALLGAGMQIAEPILGLPNSVSALGAPWLVCAFATGTVAGSRVAGAAAGATLLAGGTVLYYAALVYGYGNAAMDYAVAMTVGWGIASGVAGAAMGGMGSLWRDATGPPAVLLGAFPAAALAGEALLLMPSWDEGSAALAAELAFAAVLLWVLSRRRAPLPAALLATALLAVAFAGAEAELRDVMRAAGWHGA